MPPTIQLWAKLVDRQTLLLTYELNKLLVKKKKKDYENLGYVLAGGNILHTATLGGINDEIQSRFGQ